MLLVFSHTNDKYASLTMMTADNTLPVRDTILVHVRLFWNAW